LLVKDDWQRVFAGSSRPGFERKLAEYLPKRRWFGGKARNISRARVVDALGLSGTSDFLTLVRVRFEGGARETYLLPLAFVSGSRAAALERAFPDAIVTRLSMARSGSVIDGILYDAVYDPSFAPALLEIISGRRRLKGKRGVARGTTTRKFRQLWPRSGPVYCRLLGQEQTNTSILIGDRFILKLIRKVETGVNPELELGRFFARKSVRVRVPPLAGALELHREETEPSTLAILQGFIASEGDAWTYSLKRMRRLFADVLSGRDLEPPPPSVMELSAQEPSRNACEAMGDYLDWARLLGIRIAELHRVLGAGTRDTSFAPEPLSPAYGRSLHRSLRSLTAEVFRALRQRLAELPRELRVDADLLLAREGELLHRFRAVRKRELRGRRIRGHGDLHLGQVLCTGDDFVILDFEGEPARPLRERREKHTPLRDVAGMLRSFHYVAFAALEGETRAGGERAGELRGLEPAARFGWRWSAAAFLRGYLDLASSGDLLPRSRAEIAFLLDLLLLEKAIYEMGYELNHRPAWLGIPMQAVLEAVDAGLKPGETLRGDAGGMEK